MISWENYENGYKYAFIDEWNVDEVNGFLSRLYLKQNKTIDITKRKHKQTYYTNIYCSFDIETTKIEHNNTYNSFMYIAQIQVNEFIFLCRKWSEVVKILTMLSVMPNGTICAVANLSYEWQFIRKRLQFNKVFAKNKREVLQAEFNNLLFIDILSINNSNLKKLAETYTNTQKLVGDLDYNIIRNSKTELSGKEIAYCLNDTIICVEFMQYLFKNIIIPKKYIPLTSTNILRNEVKEHLSNFEKEEKNKIRKNIFFQHVSEELYNYCERYLFRGGYVHSSAFYTNQILNNVQAFDKKSSYPQSMLFKYVPCSKFYDNTKDLKRLNYYIKKYCCIIECEFYNIKHTTLTSLESKHKLIDYKNITIDNGRILKADYIKVALTELDLELYTLYYKWDKLKITKLYTAKRGLLPKFIRDKVVYYYNLKNTTPKDTLDYKLAKAKLNSFYGMCVTKKNNFDYIYENQEVIEQEIENAKENATFNFMWGVWITAHSRNDLMTLSYVVNDYLIYNDTDSLYCIDNKHLQEVVGDYNEKTIQKQLEISKQENYNCPDIELLGIYENDGFYEKFKTLGAKRYIKQHDNKIVVTCSGLPKDLQTNIDFNSFTNNLTVKGCKNRTIYNDSEIELMVNDNKTMEYMQELSNIAIVPTDFTMNIKQDYLTLVYNINKIMSRGTIQR